MIGVTMIGTDRGRFARALVVFALGSIAQGVPFALVAVHVQGTDGNPGWVAAVGLTRLAPYLLCSPLAGAVVARLSPHRVFALCGATRTAIALGLWAGLAWGLPNVTLLVLLFALVAFGTPAYPALMSVVHDAPMNDRHRAAAVGAGVESAAFWVGPALGGMMLTTGAAGAMPICVVMSAVSSLLAGSAIAGDVPPTDEPSSLLIRRAARHLVQQRTRGAVVAVLLVNLLIGLVSVLLVSVAGQFDGPRGRIFGALTLVQGVGAVLVFVVLVGPWRIQHRPRVPLAAAVISVAVLAVGDRIVIAIAGCAIFGAAALASEVVVSASVSEELPGDLVAPAIGLLDTGMIAAMLLGTMSAPPLIALTGVSTALMLASGAAAVGLLVGTTARFATCRAPVAGRRRTPPIRCSSAAARPARTRVRPDLRSRAG